MLFKSTPNIRESEKNGVWSILSCKIVKHLDCQLIIAVLFVVVINDFKEISLETCKLRR